MLNSLRLFATEVMPKFKDVPTTPSTVAANGQGLARPQP